MIHLWVIYPQYLQEIKEILFSKAKNLETEDCGSSKFPR